MATEFLTKPFNDRQLLDSVEQALARDREHRQEQSEISKLHRNSERVKFGGQIRQSP